MTFTNSMLFDPHISLVSQLVREGIAVFSLGKETQRGCDLLKDHVRGNGRVLPETADWSLPSQESPGDPEPGGHLQHWGASRSWVGGSKAESSFKSVTKASVSYLMRVMVFGPFVN